MGPGRMISVDVGLHKIHMGFHSHRKTYIVFLLVTARLLLSHGFSSYPKNERSFDRARFAIESPHGIDKPVSQQEMLSEIIERLDKINSQMKSVGNKIESLETDIGHIKGHMAERGMVEAVEERFGKDFVQELEIRSLPELAAVIPPSIEALCYGHSADILVRYLEPFVEPCADAVLYSIRAKWESAIISKQQELQNGVSENDRAELYRLERNLEVAFPAVAGYHSGNGLHRGPTLFPTSSSSVGFLYDSSPPSNTNRIVFASRLIAVDSIAETIGKKDYLSGFSELKAAAQAFLNYFDNSCDLYSRMGPGLIVLGLVVVHGREWFHRNTLYKDPLKLPPDQRLYSFFYCDNTKEQVAYELRNRVDLFDREDLIHQEIRMDFQGCVHLVPTPEEFLNILPNKAFCLLKTGQTQRNAGSKQQSLEQLHIHLDVLHAVMVILLTELEGVGFDVAWRSINVRDVDFSREGAFVALQLKRGACTEDKRTSLGDKTTSIVSLGI